MLGPISRTPKRYLALALLLLGCDDDPAPGTPASATAAPADAPSAAEGRALVERFECARCHTGLDVPAVAKGRSCTGCHQRILAADAQPGSPELEWQAHIVHLTAPLDLASARRLRPTWIASHLERPVDVRPHLGATMPRLRLTADQARAIAAYVTRDAPDAASVVVEEHLAATGRGLVESKACTGCHAMKGTGLAGPEVEGRPNPAVAFAPDLSLTRERMTPATVDRWLDDPAAFGSTLMPKPELTAAERRAVVAFLMTAPLDSPPGETPPPIPTLTEDVTYADVEKRVFRKVCWHCHAQPDFARGDGGPGMSGGFGFAPRKLDLSTYEGILAGYVDDGGRRRSVFRPDESGEPLLLAVLLRRRHEEAGDLSNRRGMPLGLPSLPAEDIALVRRWLEAGHPR